MNEVERKLRELCGVEDDDLARIDLRNPPMDERLISHVPDEITAMWNELNNDARLISILFAAKALDLSDRLIQM